MNDITKCDGNGCLIKDTCKRYTSVTGLVEMFFVVEPFTIENNIFECELYWGEDLTKLYDSLQNIVDPTSEKQN